MTDKKTIFKTGEITYDKEWYIKSGLTVKPVVYTEQFLKEIASVNKADVLMGEMGVGSRGAGG